MSQQELLSRLVTALERAGIPYMLTGSVVSSIQGEPRSTHDIDVVVVIKPAEVAALAQAFPADRFYLDFEAVRAAIGRNDMFNLVDTDTGYKIDFWMLTDDALDQSRFRRRYHVDVDGVKAAVSRPEDTIIQKLKWCLISEAVVEKQLGDAVGVFKVNSGQLDTGYIEEWVHRLGIVHLWDRLLAESQRKGG